MVNFAEDACTFSCLLPLLAFLLLGLQFYRASISKSHHGPAATLLEEFPSHLPDLVSITSQLAQSPMTPQHKSMTAESQPKSTDDTGKYLEKRKRRVQRQSLQLSTGVLKGCNVGLSKMIYINRLYFARSETISKPLRQVRRKKITTCPKATFEPTRLVTIVQGLQY